MFSPDGALTSESSPQYLLNSNARLWDVVFRESEKVWAKRPGQLFANFNNVNSGFCRESGNRRELYAHLEILLHGIYSVFLHSTEMLIPGAMKTE